MHPVLFHLGPVPVRAYGLLILIGFLIALRYLMARARTGFAGHTPDSPGFPTPEQIFDCAIVGLLAGIAGTRIVYVALNIPTFAADPLAALRLWEGGLSFIGAPLFGLGYAWWYCRRAKLSFAIVGDMAAPGFALAYVFGRIGCFLNGCCYGHATSLPWACQFHPEGAPETLTPPSHPAQLYASLINIGVFLVLNRMLRRPHRDGQVLVAYGLLYAVYRFVNEFARSGSTAEVAALGLTLGQIMCLGALPILGFFVWRLRDSNHA